jgi:hypothetical protein
VVIGGSFGPDLLNLDELRQELVQAADQLQTALRFHTHFQQLLQGIQFEGKLAGNSVRQQAVGTVIDIDFPRRAAMEQQMAIGE